MKKLYDNKTIFFSDFGSNCLLKFPSNTIIDEIVTDDKIIKQVKTLLNTEEMLLVQADAWAIKKDNNILENIDQRMHMDYGNNSFLHPSHWDTPECVSMIIYLSNVKITGGGTAFVPKSGDNDKCYQFRYKNLPGISKYPFINNKTLAQNYFKLNDSVVFNFRKELDKGEIILDPDCGDILFPFYILDTWH